jgi:hypothetical protein
VDIIWKFADDPKIDQKMTSMRDREKLQETLDNLKTWAKTWGMEFNIPKCIVMHAGSTNLMH